MDKGSEVFQSAMTAAEARRSESSSASCSTDARPSAAAQMASSRLLTSFTCNKEGSGEEFHSGTTSVAARLLPNGLVDQTALPHFAGCLPQLYRHATVRWRNSRNASLLARVPNR